MKSREIIDLLAKKHDEDVFVTECKNGPSQGNKHVRMDAWVMNKSWANPCVTGYEVKVSRADFIADNKWPSYLPLCNQFYFICPSGIIKPEEVSPDAGLMWVSKTGGMTITKKKAPYRQVIIPEELFRYILMCRTRIDGERDESSNKLDYWRRWLEGREEAKSLAYRVSSKIREHVSEVNIRCTKLENQMAKYDRIRELLIGMGFPEREHEWLSEYNVRKKIGGKILDPWVKANVERAITQLNQVQAELVKGDA